MVAATHGPADLRVLERLARYEAHLSREIQRTRRELAEVPAERRAAEHHENCETNSRPEGTAAPAGAAVIRAAEHHENCETNSRSEGTAAPAGAAIIRTAEHSKNCKANSPLDEPSEPAAPALPPRSTAAGSPDGPSPASRPQREATVPRGTAVPPLLPCDRNRRLPSPALPQPRPTAVGTPAGPCPAMLPQQEATIAPAILAAAGGCYSRARLSRCVPR